jgi:hypothetical protein
MAEVKLTILGDDKSGPARQGLLETEKAIGMVKTAAAALGISLSAMALVKYATDAALMTARYNTMGATMTVVGNNAGYTRAQMDGFETSLRKTGIAMIESRETLTKMSSAHIDLAKSAELARVAQDAAVIGGINSTEAFGRMIQGIQSGEVEVLRNIGINVNFEDSYKKLGKQIGKNAEDLTEYEKVQARTNAVLEKGKDIARTYEAAMGLAGKQITSMKRYMDDLKVKAGEVFQDALTVAVGVATDGLKGLNKETEELAKKKQLDQWGRDALMAMAFVADGVQGVVKLFTAATKTIIWSAQEIFGWASIARNALSGDFAAVGAWWDWMTQKTNEYNASMSKTLDVTSFQDRAKGYLTEKDAAMKNVDALKATEEARIKAGAANRAEQESKAKQEASEKSFMADLKNNITGIKNYASAMKDLGKERLALSNDRYQEKLKQEIDRYKEGKAGLEDMIKPLRVYNTQINAVYNERLVNERSALDKIAGLYSEFRSKVTITANAKEVKQQGVEILREVKAQAEQIIAVESDRYKTLIAGEQAYASAVLGLIQAKKNEIKELQTRFEDANKSFEEKKRSALGDYSGGFGYLDPALDALGKRQAMINKLRVDEEAYSQIADPKRQSDKMLSLIESWDKLDQQVDLAGQTVITRQQAIGEVEQERTRIQEKIIANAEREKAALEETYNKAVGRIDQYKQKVVELDDLLRGLTKDITINLTVNGMEQLNRIQGIVGQAVTSPFSSQPSGGPVDTTDYSEAALYNAVGPDVYNSWPQYATGTDYVPRTGPAIVHQGEKIIPANQNNGSSAPITIQSAQFILPNVTNQTSASELFRQLTPMLDKYNDRTKRRS